MIGAVTLQVHGQRLRCDAPGCGVTLTTVSEDASALVEEAAEAGWHLGAGLPGEMDLCPKHASQPHAPARRRGRP